MVRVLTVRKLSALLRTNLLRTLEYAASAGRKRLEKILKRFHYTNSGDGHQLSELSAQSQVIVVAVNPPDFARVAIVSSATPKPGEDATGETEKPLNSRRTRIATACLKS